MIIEGSITQFSQEQKGSHKGTRDAVDLLYINQNILQEGKTRQKNVAMALTDDKNTYDVQTWITECLKIFKILEEVINFFTGVIENERNELAAREQTQV